MARFTVGDRVQYHGNNSKYGKRGEVGTVTEVRLKTRDSYLGGDNYAITTDGGKATEWYDKEVTTAPAPPIDHSVQGKTKKRFGLF